jgi:hypothetical protein
MTIKKYISVKIGLLVEADDEAALLDAHNHIVREFGHYYTRGHVDDAFKDDPKWSVSSRGANICEETISETQPE